MANDNGRRRQPETPEEMETFRVRMFTNIPSNCVLVGENIFTKNRKVYQKALFHMPWFKSRYIKLETQNTDLAKNKFELEGGSLSVVADVAVSWRIKPVGQTNYKMNPIRRWQSIIDGFRTKTVSSVLKTVGLAAATVLGGMVFSPALIAIPALTAGYITLFHQDQDWVNEQGAVQHAYNSASAMKELEQSIYGELEAYFASHTYEEVKGRRLDLSDPMFAALRRTLDEYSEQYGIEVTRLNLKSIDLTPESNDTLRRQKEADVQAYAAQKRAEGKQFDYDRIQAFMDSLEARGYTREQIIELIKLDQATRNGAAVVVGGGASPIISMPTSGRQAPSEPTDGDDPMSQGGRTR